MAPCSFSSRREIGHVAKCFISDIDLNVSLDSTLEYSDDMGVDGAGLTMSPNKNDWLVANSDSLERWSVLLRFLVQDKFPNDNLCFTCVWMWFSGMQLTKRHKCDTQTKLSASGLRAKTIQRNISSLHGGLYKSVGQIVGNMAQKGHTTSSLPKNNFVVPDVKVLRNEIGQLDCSCEFPGVMLSNINRSKTLLLIDHARYVSMGQNKL